MMYSWTSQRYQGRRTGGDRGIIIPYQERSRRGTDKGNQPNVQTVTLPLYDESDVSHTPEEDSIFIKAGNI